VPANDQSGSTHPAGGNGPLRRPTYPDAVRRYEQGIRLLQEHKFREAADAFRSVLTQYPEEKELNDRARLYLALCERQTTSAPEPGTTEERLYAATLALNAGDSATALRHLGNIVSQDPNHDGALYMLAVVHALREDSSAALLYLQRAIERNPENRSLALQDSDLERLMQDRTVRMALETGPVPRAKGKR
jgi:outer membrane protein assembly factor BamD (BamD/ComL family)